MYIIKSILFPFLWIITSFYALSIKTTDGNTKQLSDFKGSKVLIVVLPITKTTNDSLYLQSINSCSIKYGNNVVVIGVPSVEEGYDSTKKTDLISYYRSILGQQVLLMDGAKTYKSSSLQDPLFQWLTNKANNGQFDRDSTGAGYKFFINENGRLYALFSPNVKLSDKLLKKVLFP